MKKSLSILSVIYFFFLISCTSPISPDREVQDSIAVRKLKNINEPDVANVQENFFVLRDYSSQLDIFHQNQLDSTIQLLNQVKTISGVELHGGRVLKKVIAFDNSQVAVMKYNPDTLIIINAQYPYVSNKISFNIPSNERLFDFTPLNDQEIIFITYNVRTFQESYLYKLNLKTLQSTLLHKLAFKEDVADLLKIKIDKNQHVLIIDPFHRELTKLDVKKGTTSKEKYHTPSDFNYNVLKTVRFSSAQEYFNATEDSTERTRVVDFILTDESLLLIVNQGTDRTVRSRHLIRCTLNGDSQPKNIHTDKTPLNFSHDKHIFFSSDKDSLNQVNIVPFRQLSLD